MPSRSGDHATTMADVLQLLKEVQEEHALKIKLSTVPRPSSGYKQGAIILATAYASSGRKISEVEPQQYLWPTSAYKNLYALQVYLITMLVRDYCDFEALMANRQKEEDHRSLTPLEDYIARSFSS